MNEISFSFISHHPCAKYTITLLDHSSTPATSGVRVFINGVSHGLLCQSNNYSFLLYTGLFIFLSFALSGKALELYRAKFTNIWRYLTAEKNANCATNYRLPSTCVKGSPDTTQDTRLWIVERVAVPLPVSYVTINRYSSSSLTKHITHIASAPGLSNSYWAIMEKIFIFSMPCRAVCMLFQNLN